MIKIVSNRCVILLIPFVCLFLFPPGVSAQPKIFFEEVTFDAGTVEQGTEVAHVFTFVNQGIDELVIQKVSTS